MFRLNDIVFSTSRKKSINYFFCLPSIAHGPRRTKPLCSLTGACPPRKVQILNRFHVVALNAFVSAFNCSRLEVANVSIKMCWVRSFHSPSIRVHYIHLNRSNDNTIGLCYCFRFLRWFQMLLFPFFGTSSELWMDNMEHTLCSNWKNQSQNMIMEFKKEKKMEILRRRRRRQCKKWCWRKSTQLQNRARIYLLFASGTRSAFTAQSQLYHFLASGVNLQHLSKWHNTWAACICTTETYEKSVNNRFAYMWRAANAMHCLVDDHIA